MCVSRPGAKAGRPAGKTGRREFVRELTDTPDDFASRDRVQIAVQQLGRPGL